jgi:hypothetical protein
MHFYDYQNIDVTALPSNVMARNSTWILPSQTSGNPLLPNLDVMYNYYKQNRTNLFYSQFGSTGCINLVQDPSFSGHDYSSKQLPYFTEVPLNLNAWYPTKCQQDAQHTFLLFSPANGLFYDGVTQGELTAEQMVTLKSNNTSFWLPATDCVPIPSKNSNGLNLIGNIPWAQTNWDLDNAAINNAFDAEGVAYNLSAASTILVKNTEYPNYGNVDYSFIHPNATICARVTCQQCPPGRSRSGRTLATKNYARQRLGHAYINKLLRLTLLDLEAVCPMCPPGTFSDVSSPESAKTCLPCPGGTWAIFNGSTSCLPCPLGFYCNSESAIIVATNNGAATKPIACDVGTYANTTNLVQCFPCPLGESTTGKATILKTECLKGAVPPGYVFASWVSNSTEALHASEGKIMRFDNVTQPAAPAVMTIANFNNKRFVPWNAGCPPGTFAFGPRLFENGNTANTSNGTFNSRKCQNCPIGRFADLNHTALCMPCGFAGSSFYQDQTGQTSCKRCVWTNNVGYIKKCNNFNIVNDKDCARGFVIDTERSKCRACPPNTIANTACVSIYKNSTVSDASCTGSACVSCHDCPVATDKNKTQQGLIPNLKNAAWQCVIAKTANAEAAQQCYGFEPSQAMTNWQTSLKAVYDIEETTRASETTHVTALAIGGFFFVATWGVSLWLF